jgi:hypothetical protein
MKKIIVISVIIVLLIGLTIFYYSQQTGYIKIEVPGFEADLNLRGRWSHRIISSSSNELIRIRAGVYKPEQIVIRLVKASDQWWSILCRREPWGKLSTINITKANTTTLEFGPPFLIHTDIQQRNRTASIGLALIGRAGEHYSPQVLTHNGPLSAPAITIVDESGKELATGKFEYG